MTQVMNFGAFVRFAMSSNFCGATAGHCIKGFVGRASPLAVHESRRGREG